jgi:hypothetical protein
METERRQRLRVLAEGKLDMMPEDEIAEILWPGIIADATERVRRVLLAMEEGELFPPRQVTPEQAEDIMSEFFVALPNRYGRMPTFWRYVIQEVSRHEKLDWIRDAGMPNHEAYIEALAAETGMPELTQRPWGSVRMSEIQAFAPRVMQEYREVLHRTFEDDWTSFEWEMGRMHKKDPNWESFLRSFAHLHTDLTEPRRALLGLARRLKNSPRLVSFFLSRS